MNIAELKAESAERAVARVRSGMVVGLGTGSTAHFVVSAIGRRMREGSLKNILGVPTSERTAEHARSIGIALTTFEAHPALDIAIDGADEVAPDLNLIKGLGGALFREKIVASAAKQFIVVVDETKLVKKLGTKAPLPVEVEPFGWELMPARIRKLGAEPVLRKDHDGGVYLTDGKNHILDCRWPNGIDDAAAVHRALKEMVGVVETGLFIGMTTEVVVAASDGVRVMTR